MKLFILSGGGANGAFQAGALDCLNELGIESDYCYGISVGALNGAMIQQDKHTMLSEIWHNITRKDVLAGWIPANLLLRGGAYHNDNLLDLIKENVNLDDFNRPFAASYVDLVDGKAKIVEVLQNNGDNVLIGSDLHKGILASTSIPMLHTPVRFKGVKGNDQIAVDGGVRDLTPIGWAINSARTLYDKPIEHIVFINCFPTFQSQYSKDWDMKGLFKTTKVASRAVSIMLDEILENDIATFIRINRIIGMSGQERIGRYRNIPYTIIDPKNFLGGSMNFGRERLDRIYNEGYKRAEAVLQYSNLR